MDLYNINVDLCSLELLQKDKDRPLSSMQSSPFVFQRSNCQIKVILGWESNQQKLKVYVKGDPVLYDPFYATIVLFQGSRFISFPKKLIKDQNSCILSIPYSDVEEKLPGKRRLGLKVTLQKYPVCSYDQNNSGEKFTQTAEYEDENNSLERLSKDFEKLLNGNLDPDVVIKCGSVVLKAHKTILEARSSYFLSKLQLTTEGRIEIPYMDPSVFHMVMHYIYTGKFPDLNFEMAKELLKAGDLVNTGNLKERCIEFLMEGLSMKNACECLAMTDNGELKERIISYIIENKIPFIDKYWKPFCDQYKSPATDVLNVLVKIMLERSQIVE